MTHTRQVTRRSGEHPAHVPPELLHVLDHWNGPEYLTDPIGFWDDLRDRFRVFWSPAHGGFWCLTRYQDVHEAFQNPGLFSSSPQNIPPRDVRLIPTSIDPPEHTGYRRLLNEPFAPAQIERLGPRIAEVCAELLDRLSSHDACEFVAEFAQALPAQVFLELMGLPADEIDKFVGWNYTIMHVNGADGRERQRQANEEVQAYLAELIAYRRNHAGNDLVSFLLPLPMDGRTLSDDELVNFSQLLFMAGLDTVTSALAWSWKFLADNPDHRQQIVDDPALIPGAVEEPLRFHSFVNPARRVTRDAEFAGVQMKAGDRIMLPTSSAGRDERQFPNAMTVDFTREPNRHLAFAAGPHRCLGSHLARMELRTAMRLWHERIPHYCVPEGAEVPYHGGAVVGIDALPLRLG